MELATHRGAHSRATYVRQAQSAVTSIVAAFGDATDLPALLERVGGLVVGATGAARASFFLLQDGGRLGLWSVTGGANPALWDVGLSMPSISLDDVPLRRQVVEAGTPVMIADAAASPLVPDAWVEAFGLASLAVAPLECGGTPLGVLAVDYPDFQQFSPSFADDLHQLAQVCALAISHALSSETLRQRNQDLEDLVMVSRAVEVGRPAVVARLACDALRRLLEASMVLIEIAGPDDEPEELAHAGRAPEPERWLRPALVRVRRDWATASAPEPTILPGPDGCESGAVCLPLLGRAEQLIGVVVATEPDRGVDPDVLSMASALTAHVGMAIDRAQLEQDVAVGAQVAQTLLAVGGLDQDDQLVAELRRRVPELLGFQVEALWTRLHGRQPEGPVRGEEVELWRRWRRRRTRPEPADVGDVMLAPVWRSGRLLGMVVATATDGAPTARERQLLETLATALSAPLERTEQRLSAESRERELAVAVEDQQLRADLNATAGRLLENIVIYADRIASGVAPSTESRNVAHLARSVLTTLRLTTQRLPAATYTSDGLAAALGELVSTVAMELDANGDFQLRGAPRPLDLATERHLLRVAHDVLDIARNGRAGILHLRLEFGDDSVQLVFRDDGIDVAERVAADHLGGQSLRLIRDRTKEAGGRLSLTRTVPRGIEIRVALPA